MHPIGIDLGTTFSAITKWVSKPNFVGSQAYQIPSETSDTLPSKVYLEKDEDNGQITFVVGSTAANMGVINPDNFISAVKRSMDETDYNYLVYGNSFSPVDISAEIIKFLLKQAEAVEAPSKYVPMGVVVTVPYYFKHNQNLNTKNAAIKAIQDLYSKRAENIDELFLGLVAEPIAAGLDYAFSQSSTQVNNENFLIFDLGGGTFDVTVFSLSQTENAVEFEVLAIDGDDRLGGEDFDRSLFLWVCDKEDFDLNSLADREKGRALKKILPEITKAKVDLSGSFRTMITVPYAVRELHIDLEAKRKDFEKCISGENGDKRNYLDEIVNKLDLVLFKAKMSAGDINSVLLTGGSSQIPCIKEIIENKFGAAKVRNIANVQLAVARGAAIYAAYLLDKKLMAAGKPRKHLDRWEKIEIVEPTAHNLGIPTSRVPFLTILRENSITPAAQTRIFNPTVITPDGTKAVLEKLVVLQGNKKNHAEIGQISVGDIYTHGRKRTAIPIRITFTATTTLVRVRIHVAQGKADKSDLIIEEPLSFQTS